MNGLQRVNIPQDLPLEGVPGQLLFVFNSFSQHQVTQKVAQFERDFLAVEAFVNWLIFVQGVAWQEGQVFEWVLALEQPLHLEVGHELQLVLVDRGALGTVLLIDLVLLEAFSLVAGIGFTLHPGNPLEAP